MKKHTLFIALISILILFVGPVSAQDEAKEKPKRYVGVFTLEEVLSHDERYADNAFIYIPNPDALAVFKSVSEPVTIKLFYRTDCIDSVREVPRFIKTIQLAENPLITVEYIGVDRGRSEPAGLVEGWDLQRVPTFIVLHNEQEVGRVIESAKVKIEVDLAEILQAIAE